MFPDFEDRELPQKLKDRSLPNDVFCYPLVTSWRNRVWEMISAFVTPEVIEEFKLNPPEYVVSDDLSWLDDLIFDVTGEFTDIKRITATALRSEFKAFRAAHATRTNDLTVYYRDGLRILTNEEIENIARGLFLSGKFTYVSERTLERAIQDLNSKDFPYRTDDIPRLYLCADESDFLTRSGCSGHYLDFGSEYLFNLAIRLVGEFRAKQELRSVGRPTMLIFDVPMTLISEATLEDFAGSILEFFFCELVDDLEAHALSPGAGSAMILAYELPAETVVGHYHPDTFFHSHR